MTFPQLIGIEMDYGVPTTQVFKAPDKSSPFFALSLGAAIPVINPIEMRAEAFMQSGDKVFLGIEGSLQFVL